MVDKSSVNPPHSYHWYLITAQWIIRCSAMNHPLQCNELSVAVQFSIRCSTIDAPLRHDSVSIALFLASPFCLKITSCCISVVCELRWESHISVWLAVSWFPCDSCERSVNNYAETDCILLSKWITLIADWFTGNMIKSPANCLTTVSGDCRTFAVENEFDCENRLHLGRSSSARLLLKVTIMQEFEIFMLGTELLRMIRRRTTASLRDEVEND